MEQFVAMLWTCAGCILLAMGILYLVRRRIAARDRRRYSGYEGIPFDVLPKDEIGAPYYVVERISPPDGILGSYSEPFTLADVAHRYGQGRYIVRRYAPDRPIMERTVTVSRNYGPSRPGHES